ncbi:MAG TPA: hypothetical protein VKP11_06905 [Frankiaceae bacterium]|nr:hypothetical protein [Frankiaceae bacterium]
MTEVFTTSPVGYQLGAAARPAAKAVSAGSVDAVAASTGRLGGATLTAARESFVVGFHDAMTLCGVLAFVAAVVAVTMLRNKDLHSTALSLVPPEAGEAEPAPVGAGVAEQRSARPVAPV